MVSYERPKLPVTTFSDASGAIIEYGRRWRDRPGNHAPVDTYSVVTHPERFAPLHAVADALVAYLTAGYDAATRDGLEFIPASMVARDNIIRALLVQPASADAAPLTFIYTNFPGIRLHAGLLHDFPYPDCGCDACDETAEDTASGLEELVIAVAEGRYQESYDGGDHQATPTGRWTAIPPSERAIVSTAPSRPHPGTWARFAITGRDGGARQSGGGPADRSRLPRHGVDHVDYHWQPWPQR